MKEDSMLMCLIAFVLGYLVDRMIRGNGLSVGGIDITDAICKNDEELKKLCGIGKKESSGASEEELCINCFSIMASCPDLKDDMFHEVTQRVTGAHCGDITQKILNNADEDEKVIAKSDLEMHEKEMNEVIDEETFRRGHLNDETYAHMTHDFQYYTYPDLENEEHILKKQIDQEKSLLSNDES